MHIQTAKPVEILSIAMCYLLDMPNSGLDCSTVNSTICIFCPVRSLYFTGGTVSDVTSTGHLVCSLLWLLCVVLGILGIWGNALIIIVLHKRYTSDKGFDYFLKMLAWFDLICCVTGILASTVITTYLENWIYRGFWHNYSTHILWNGLLFIRSCSQYMTIIVTIERFLLITFPFRGQSWFSVGISRLISLMPVVIAVFLILPRFITKYVAESEYRWDKWDIPSLRYLDYYLKPTMFVKFWHPKAIFTLLQFDYWAPLPILLVLNFLSYLQVRKFSRRRAEMKSLQNRSFQAVKMFLPVTIVLVCLNFVPMAMVYGIRYYRVVYREVSYLVYVSITLNSSVNFLIYYQRSKPFREETHAVLPDWITKKIYKS